MQSFPTFILNESIHTFPSDTKPLETCGGLILNLLLKLGYPVENLPYAQCLSKLYAPDVVYDYVLSPIQYEASHNNVFVVDEGEALALKTNDMMLYFNALKTFIEAQMGSLIWVNAWTWLLKLPKAPALQAPPPKQICHLPMRPFIDKTHESPFWRVFLTETQMLLSTIKGLHNPDPVNGVWVYGAGTINKASTIDLVTDHQALMPLLSALSDSASNQLNFAKLKSNKIYILDTPVSDKLKEALLKLKHYQLYANDVAYEFKKRNLLSRILGQ